MSLSTAKFYYKLSIKGNYTLYFYFLFNKSLGKLVQFINCPLYYQFSKIVPNPKISKLISHRIFARIMYL